ncbi:hypothetical protein I050019G5_19810 [Collinsella sp. i05-0019-G5]
MGARPPAKVGAPGAGFHGAAPTSGNVTKCVETNARRIRERGWGGRWLPELSLAPAPGNSEQICRFGHALEEARVPGVGSDKPDEAHVGTRGGLEPQNRVL